MPDTRPGIQFNEYGVCYPCINFEKNKKYRLGSKKKRIRKTL